MADVTWLACLDCGAWGCRIESRPQTKPRHCCRHLLEWRTLTAVSRSTQPSSLCGMVKWVSALWMSNNTNGDGWMCDLKNPAGGLKGQVCSLSMSWRPLTSFHLMTWVNSHLWICSIDYSTINIMLAAAQHFALCCRCAWVDCLAQYLDSMADIVRQGIVKAVEDLEKENQEKLMQEVSFCCDCHAVDVIKLTCWLACKPVEFICLATASRTTSVLVIVIII